MITEIKVLSTENETIIPMFKEDIKVIIYLFRAKKSNFKYSLWIFFW